MLTNKNSSCIRVRDNVKLHEGLYNCWWQGFSDKRIHSGIPGKILDQILTERKCILCHVEIPQRPVQLLVAGKTLLKYALWIPVRRYC